MNEKFQTWHNRSLFSYVGLIITVVVWYFFISPPQHTYSLILTVTYVLVLLSPAVGLIKKSLGVYMWSSYIMLIYFGHATIELWASADEKIYALLELVLSSIYFVSATMCYRYAKQLDKK